MKKKNTKQNTVYFDLIEKRVDGFKHFERELMFEVAEQYFDTKEVHSKLEE